MTEWSKIKSVWTEPRIRSERRAAAHHKCTNSVITLHTHASRCFSMSPLIIASVSAGLIWAAVWSVIVMRSVSDQRSRSRLTTCHAKLLRVICAAYREESQVDVCISSFDSFQDSPRGSFALYRISMRRQLSASWTTDMCKRTNAKTNVSETVRRDAKQNMKS